MLNTDKEYMAIGKPNRKYKITLGKTITLRILDFRKPIKKIKYQKTTYYLYDCFVNSKDNEILNERCIVQFPGKTAWSRLYEKLKKQDALDKKDIHLDIVRINNYRYEIKTYND
mgnify:CR=1 FL=1